MDLKYLILILAAWMLYPPEIKADSIQAVSVPQDESKSESQDLRVEIERLREELRSLQSDNEARIKELQDEIKRLRTLLETSASKDAGAVEDDLESLLDELGGVEEDELESLLGGLAGDEEVPLAGSKPSMGQSFGQAFQSMNPNISAIGNFIGHYTSLEDSYPDDEFRLEELELGFSSYVDPYARADFFIGLGQDEDGEWEIGLEEGYATFLTIPHDIQPRLGRFKSSFGKSNSVHLHALPWVDRPLALKNYFGDEGLVGDGLGVNWLVPNSWDKYIELTYELTNNDNELFAGDESDDFIHLVHLKNFFDITEASTLEAGLSFATAPNGSERESNRTHVQGLDITYKWRPPQSGLYKSLLWQTEVLTAHADLDVGRELSAGLYTAVDYQFDRRWAVGARYDYSELPDQSRLHENGYSAYLTFIQSEFLFWRLAYQYVNRNFELYGDKHEHSIMLQLNFGIGPHRAHKY